MTPPITALGSRYGIHGALGRSVKRAAAGGWWLTGGIPAANCIGAYQFVDNYSPSINLANPGVHDLTNVNADIYYGSKGLLDYNSGITPENDQTWSMIVRFSNAANNGTTIAGSENLSGDGKFYLWARRGSADDALYGNGGYLAAGNRVASGVLAIAGVNCYYNKALAGSISTSWSVGARTISIGGLNYGAGTDGYAPKNRFEGNIQAIAIYDIDISSHISGLTDAINALDSDYVNGVWSWYTRPQAVYYNGNMYFTSVDTQDAQVKVYSYNYAGSLLKRFYFGYGSGDDHDGASLLIRDSDKKLLAFRCGHNDTTITEYISTNAEDVSAWGAGVSLDAAIGGTTYNYPIPIQLTDETNDPIYLFYTERDESTRGEYFSISVDGGASWAAGTKLYGNGTERPYFQIIGNGTNRIDFACTNGHPREVAGCSIYHFYYTGGKYYKSDGTEITEGLPLDPADVTQVYDGSAVEGWVWDIAIDSSGYPVIVYATFPTPASDHRYRYARWNGTAWVDNEICAAGAPLYSSETYYSGGVTLDKSDPSIVYCSRVYNGQWEIFKYVTANNGVSWTETQITTGSSLKNARPFCAVGATDTSPLYWKGTYNSYTDANCYTRFRD